MPNSRADVVDAACAILREQGPGGLTMANVADRVGFSTMAVYRHVKNREELVEAAVAVALEPVTSHPEGEVDWLDGVVRWMHDLRSCFQANPWAATLLGSAKGLTPAFRDATQVVAAHLARSPLSRDAQARAMTWTCRVTIGIVLQEVSASVVDTMRLQYPTDPPDLDDDTLFADVVEQTRAHLRRLA